jgi:hypothetical protein
MLVPLRLAVAVVLLLTKYAEVMALPGAKMSRPA